MQRKSSMNFSSIEDEIELLDLVLATKPRYPNILNKRQIALKRLDLSNVETDSIEQIDHELREIYEISNLNQLIRDDELYHFHSLQLGYVSPRVRYLLDKRKYLVDKEKLAEPSMQEKLAAIRSDIPPHPTKAFLAKVLHKAKAVYDVAKKIVDIIDDLWRVITKPLKIWIPQDLVNAITPFLVGSTNLIIHFCEAVEGFLDAIKAIKKTKTVARTTKIITGFLIAAIGATGTGLCLSYIASAAGAAVSGALYMPVLIPALLTCIFIVGLGKNADILASVKKLHKKEKRELKLLEEYADKLDRTKSALIENLEAQKSRLIAERNRIVFNLPNRERIDVDTQKVLAKLNHDISAISKEQNLYSFQIDDAYQAVEKQKVQVEKVYQKKLAAERAVAFKTIELTASIIVLTGTILGTAAILGAASVATLGFLPLGIVIAGVVIASAFKLFEYIDGKKDHKYTNGMRNFFTNKIGALFGRKKELEPAPQQRSTRNVDEVQTPLLRKSRLGTTRHSTATTFVGLDITPTSTQQKPVSAASKAKAHQSVPALTPPNSGLITDYLPAARGYTPALSRSRE